MSSLTPNCVAPTILFPYIYPYDANFAGFMVGFVIATSFGWLFQFLRMRRMQSADDVSLLMWVNSALSNFIFIFYALMIRDVIVFLASAIPWIGAMLNLALIWHYRRDGFRLL